MAIKLLMPKLSDTMEEGVIAVWHKKVGDLVKSGDVLADIETDKATMEYEEFETGVVLYQVPEKSAVKVNDLMAILGKPGEDISALLSGGGAEAQPKTEPAATVAETVTATVTQTVSTVKVNATAVTMPKLSDTMSEGVIANWLVKVGDKFKSGSVLAEIETDKATMEYECYENGTVLYLAVEKGNAVKVDDVICIIGEPNADYKLLLEQLKGGSTPVAQASSQTAVQNTPQTLPTSNQTPANGHSTDERVKISPLAKQLAKDKGIDLASLKGSGENGRIVKRDIENFTPSAQPAKTESKSSASSQVALGQESFEEVPVSQMRKTIARRLSESKHTAPHFYLTMEIEMDAAMEARERMNESSPVKISFNDLVVKACAMALRKHPAVNSSWLGDKIRYNHHVHIGVAVAVDEGLLVPVVRFTDQKSLSQIAGEVKDLAQKAKNKKLQPADWAGNTFSVSNLGMFGIDEFTAIINPPDACILAVGGIKQTALVKNGQLVVGNVMKVTLSCDHRVVDGALGAAFLKTLKELLEAPVRMLV
jgi:pyruvate dehydrogenase E2 component (dihydrolipoamide acetyltransferase)